MTQPEPDSSQEYNPYELFTEELDLDAFDLEETPPEVIASSQKSAAYQDSAEAPFVTQDEDRLYTDELIRQNEMASRSLFLSVVTAAAISIGLGVWYFLSQKPTPPPQPLAPLPVPEQPSMLPPPTYNTNPTIPQLPVTPSDSIPNLPPTAPGSVPNNLPNSVPNGLPNSLPKGLPNGNSVLPAQPSPNAAVVPPPPPSTPASPQNLGR
jgi:hypothetical protein